MSNGDWTTFKNSPDYAEAMRRVQSGGQLTEIAAWVQERGWCHDIQLSSVVRNLQRARREVIVLDPLDPGRAVSLEDELANREQLDALTALERALMLQQERVEEARRLEKSLGVVLPAVGREISTLAEVASKYMTTLQSLGIAPKVPDKLLVGMAALNASGGGSPLRALPSGSLETVVQALLEAEQNGIDAPST